MLVEYEVVSMANETIEINQEELQTEELKPEQSKPKHDSQARRYLLTANDPVPKGLTHDRIIEILTGFKGLIYFCMADEEGSCYHTHIYVVFRSPVRFSTIQKRFDSKVRIDTAYGDSATCRAYVAKEGEKWEGSEKQATRIEGTFYEWGELPQEHQGARNDLTFLYEMVKNGYSNYEILEMNPEFMLRINDIERARQAIQAEENRSNFRELEVTYIWGETETGKTRYVMEKYGYENCHRVTNYKHPFDSYKGYQHDVLIFDEFSGILQIQDMLNYLDGYPIELPCRYADRQAAYTKVFIISNFCLKLQYQKEQCSIPSVWRAFLRRIDKVIHFTSKTSKREYTTQDYIANSEDWVELPEDTPTPFDS